MDISESSFIVAGDSLYDSYNYWSYKAFTCQTVGTVAAATTTTTVATSSTCPPASTISGNQFVSAASNKDTCNVNTPFRLTAVHTFCTSDPPKITSAATCQLAAKDLGLEWEKEHSEDGKWPNCYLKKDLKKVKYNPSSNPQTDPSKGDDKRSICSTLAHTLQPVNTKCGGENEDIGSEVDCEAAATDLGLTYSAVVNLPVGWPTCHLNVPSNKVQWNRKANPTPSSSTASKNKSICKRRGKL